MSSALNDLVAVREPEGASRPDFEALFEALASPYMVLDTHLNFVEVNAAYCRAVERARDELIGRNVFEMFPNPGEGGVRLRASLERVIATGQADSIPLIAYPIPAPPEKGGGFEMRYWSASHVPLLGPDGRTRFVVQNTVDVTELQHLKEIAYGRGQEPPQPGETELLLRTREVEEINRTLLQETQGLRDLFMQAPGFMAVLAGPDLRFALANSAYQQLIGHRPVIGRTVEDALPEVRGQGFIQLLRGVMEKRTPFIGQALSVRLQRTPDGPLEERFVDFIYQPILRPSGEAWGVFVEGSDVTDRVQAERQQKLLLDELNHRVKNTLATVQAIAAQTLRSNPEPAAFREAFEARLIALSATHDLLTEGSWRGAALRDVVQIEFRPFAPERFTLEGPDVSLSPAEALSLGLLFHELATNAAKYGALSGPAGCVDVRWTLEDGRLDLTWTERGGPKVSPPTRRGFGSRLIERSLKGEMGGEAVLDFAEDGLKCRVVLPLQSGSQAASPSLKGSD